MDYNDNIPPFSTRNPLQHKIISSRVMNNSKRNSFGINSKQSIKMSAADLSKYREGMQCTFEPKINDISKIRRSLDKFLKDQDKFLCCRDEKIETLRQEAQRDKQKQNTGIPIIDSKSKEIATQQQNSNSNTFERLSKQKIIQQTPQKYSFSPQILQRSKSITRQSDIGTLLYEDAKRRKQNVQIKCQSQRKHMIMKTTPKINTNTNNLVRKKILSEFAQLISDEEMNPLVAISILQQLFNVDLNPNKNQNNKRLAMKILAYIAEPNNCGVIKTDRLWTFITIIVSGSMQQITCFTREEEEKICQQFQYFYQARITKERKNILPEEPSFKPTTLRSSNKLADTYRQKICQKIDNFRQNQNINIQLKNGNYTIEDLFILNHTQKQVDNQKKKIQRQNEALKECTFKPNIKHSTQSLEKIKKKPKVILKTKENMKSKKQNTMHTQPDQQNISPFTNINIQTKSNQKKLKINKQNHSPIKNLDSIKEIKDIQKIVLRMSIGRQKRQFSNKVMERGYPMGANWNEYQKQMHKKCVDNSKKIKGLLTK